MLRIIDTNFHKLFLITNKQEYAIMHIHADSDYYYIVFYSKNKAYLGKKKYLNQVRSLDLERD